MKNLIQRYLKYIRGISFCGLILGLIGGAIADEPKEKPVNPEVEKAVNELLQAYSKLDSYIVSYSCKSGEKTAECTIAIDGKSRLQSYDIKGDGMQMRHWTTEKDELYVTMDNESMVFRGIDKQRNGISQLFDLLVRDKFNKKQQIVPNFILTETSLGAGLEIGSSAEPSWTEFMTHATIQSSDADSVTFKTPDRGILTIQRKSGIMIRQSLPNEDNPNRFIEMKNLQLNPGKDVVKDIIAKWPTADAKEQPVIAWMAPLWNQLFQYIIDFSDKEKINVDQLEKVLNQEYEVLRDFSRACIEQTPSAMSAKINWADLLTKVKASARETWNKENPRFEQDAEKAFLDFFYTPAIRLKMRDTIIEIFLTSDKFSHSVMDEIFGDGYWASLKAKTESGKAAKKLLGHAIARAYFEVIIDQKMASYWDQDEDID